jgi:hypothetical protein
MKICNSDSENLARKQNTYRPTVLWFQWRHVKMFDVRPYKFRKMLAPLLTAVWHTAKLYTEYTQKNGAISKVNKKFIYHLIRAQRTPSAAAPVQVSRALLSATSSSKLCTKLTLYCNHRSGHLKTEHTESLFVLWRHRGNWPRGPAVSMRSELLVAHEIICTIDK